MSITVVDGYVMVVALVIVAVAIFLFSGWIVPSQTIKKSPDGVYRQVVDTDCVEVKN